MQFPFANLRQCRFLYFFGLSDATNEEVLLILEHSSLRGVKQINARKNMEFWPLNPYHKRFDQKTWLSESFFEAVTSKLWNKKIHAAKTYRNGAKLNYIYTPIVLLKMFWLIHLRESHVKFTGKNKVSNTMWAKLHSLIGQQQQNCFP